MYLGTGLRRDKGELKLVVFSNLDGQARENGFGGVSPPRVAVLKSGRLLASEVYNNHSSFSGYTHVICVRYKSQQVCSISHHTTFHIYLHIIFSNMDNFVLISICNT